MANRMRGEEAPIKLMWNDCVGEGWVMFSNEFEHLHDVTRLDMLKDFIIALQNEYDEQIEIVFEGDEG